MNIYFKFVKYLNRRRMLLMTEKEKRDKGIIYDGNYNEELLNEMKKAKDLCYEYNNIRLSQVEKEKSW